MSFTLPQVNAELTTVAGQGYTEDYGSSEGADTAKWTGTLDAYFSESVVRSTAQGSLDLLRQTVLILPAAVLDVIAGEAGQDAIEQGDSLTFTHKGASHTRKVRDLRAVELAGHLGTVKVWLEDA